MERIISGRIIILVHKSNTSRFQTNVIFFTLVFNKEFLFNGLILC